MINAIAVTLSIVALPGLMFVERSELETWASSSSNFRVAMRLARSFSALDTMSFVVATGTSAMASSAIPRMSIESTVSTSEKPRFIQIVLTGTHPDPIGLCRFVASIFLSTIICSRVKSIRFCHILKFRLRSS